MAKKSPRLDNWYVEQRLRSLATIVLTRREDLAVTEAEADQDEGIDLIVTIRTRKEAALRKFGVILKGVADEVTRERANAILKPALQALVVRAFPYPVCLFFFRMANDEGFYTWVAEPAVTDEGFPVLRPHAEAACTDLDTSALHQIVRQVMAWYDAFLQKVTTGSPGNSRKSGIEVLHALLDAEAAYFTAHGQPPTLLKLPVLQAFELAKLGREHLGDLAGEIIKDGISVLEKHGLLGLKVQLVTDLHDFSLE
jgi:hypothetical protein